MSSLRPYNILDDVLMSKPVPTTTPISGKYNHLKPCDRLCFMCRYDRKMPGCVECAKFDWNWTNQKKVRTHERNTGPPPPQITIPHLPDRLYVEVGRWDEEGCGKWTENWNEDFYGKYNTRGVQTKFSSRGLSQNYVPQPLPRYPSLYIHIFGWKFCTPSRYVLWFYHDMIYMMY